MIDTLMLWLLEKSEVSEVLKHLTLFLNEWLMRKEGDEFSGEYIDLPELAVSPRQVGHNLT